MTSNIAHQQHIKWLQQQVALKRIALAQMEEQVEQLRDDIEYFELTLKVYQNNSTETYIQKAAAIFQANMSPNQSEWQIESGKHLFIKNNLSSNSRRLPKQMLRFEFRKKSLVQIIEAVLNSQHKSLSADDIARAIFLTQNNNEYVRARNSLSTELRRGAKNGKWQKIGRGFYAAL